MSFGFGFGVGRRAHEGLLQRFLTSPLPPAPVGFAHNGASNGALRAMLARVGGGTGRGRIVFKGDSTTIGQGAGRGAGGLNGARRVRPPAKLADTLCASGMRTLDNGYYGSAGCYDAGVAPELYDDRLTRAVPPWKLAGGNDTFRGFAGAGFLSDATGALGYELPSVDTFDVVFYNSNSYAIDLTIDGAAPAAVTLAGASGSPAAAVEGQIVRLEPGQGFSRIVVKAATVGTHMLRMTTAAGTTAGQGALRSITGYDGGLSAIDVLCHAACGAQSAEQARTRPDLWGNNDALAFDAPDLTIVNLGLNDGAHGVAPQAYATNLQAIVDHAKLSGDVLLVAPHPAADSFASLATQAAMRDAAAAVAADSNVAFLSLFDHFGGTFDAGLAGRMSDGVVHGDAAFYAEIGSLYGRCMRVMAA